MSVIYRSPSQSNNELDWFLSNLQKLVSDINNRKPALSIITGDFNARSQSWWSNDISTTERSKLLAFSSSDHFSQLIKEPADIKTNSTYCIDLICTDKPDPLVDSGYIPHYQIIYATFNLSYPSLYQRLVWDCKKADPNNIKKTLELVNHQRLFDQKSIDSQVATSNDIYN